MGIGLDQATLDATDLQTADMDIQDAGVDWGESNQWYWQNLSCHWRVLGKEENRPLVLLHGFGASSGHWRHNAAALAAAGFRVYGLDLIGFGASAQPGVERDRPLDNLLWGKQLAAFLEQIVDVSRWGKAVLIGNSLGGLTALTTAALRPELVAAVVAAPLPDPALIQPLDLQQPEWWCQLKSFFLRLFFRLLPLELIVPLITHTGLLRAALQVAYNSNIQADKELLRLIARPAQRPTAARSLRAMSIGMTLRPREATAPALLDRLTNNPNRPALLLLWGQKDRLVPLTIGQHVEKQYPWASLSVIEKSGHCPHDESANEFHQAILPWLDRNLEIDRQWA